MKRAVDRFFLGGVNHIVYHGTPFSPPGEEWPGFLFYASVHFGPTNPFWNDFAALNRYVARCQSFLQSGKPDSDVLLYWPIYDSWSQPGRALLQHYGGGIESALGVADGQVLMDAGYAFDFISDRQLANVQFADHVLQTGGASYQAMVLPETRLMPLKTFEKLVELAHQGATVIVRGSLPSDVPGWGSLDERRRAFQMLAAQIKFVSSGADIQTAKVGQGHVLLGSDLKQLLSAAGIRRESLVDQGLQFIRRRQGEGKSYFIVNPQPQPVDGWVTLKASARSVAIFDPMREEKALASRRVSEAGVQEVYLQLAPGESCILKTFETVVRGPLYKYFETKGAPQPIKGAWSVSFVEGGPVLPLAVEIRELTSWTNFAGEDVEKFSGAARYAISFEEPGGKADAWLLDLGHVAESARLKLNGKALGTLLKPPYQVRLPKDLMRWKNRLEVVVSNLMANRIADLDRRNVNWKRFYN